MMIFGLSMENRLNLCAKQQINVFIYGTPESFEVSLCLTSKLKKELGWFIDPNLFQKKLLEVLKSTSSEQFLRKNHPILIDKLQQEFKPLMLQSLTICSNKEKLVYET